MKIGVIGTGAMGHGIAQAAAAKGFEVMLYGRSKDSLEKAISKIGFSLERLEKKGRLAEEKEVILSRITMISDLALLKDASIIIEAIKEDEQEKSDLYKRLDKVCAKGCIFASNTSSLSITRLGDASGRPDRFIGLHFFNPVVMMDLVEIIIGKKTSEETREIVTMFIEDIAKTPVTVMDSPGFVTSRLIMIMINEAIHCLDEGIASREDIDKAMKLGMNHPLGPLELADLVGLDVVLAILETMYKQFSNDKYRPSPLLAKKVGKGELGRKTLKGFYDYPA